MIISIEEFVDKINAHIRDLNHYNIDNSLEPILDGVDSLRNEFIEYSIIDILDKLWINNIVLSKDILTRFEINPEQYWKYVIAMLNSILKEDILIGNKGVELRNRDIRVAANQSRDNESLYDYCNSWQQTEKIIWYGIDVSNAPLKKGYFFLENPK